MSVERTSSAADEQGGAERRRRYPLAKVKGGWTQEEDRLLKKLVDELGEGNWSIIARRLNTQLGKPPDTGRIGKQCRERFNHHLRPDIRKDAWTEEEEQLLVQAHLRFGNRWSDIAKVIRGRTENSVKNHWNATLRRKDGDRACAKGMQQQQQHTSTVLKDYMVSISLLPGLDAPMPPVARSCDGPSAASTSSQLAGAGAGAGAVGRQSARRARGAKRPSPGVQEDSTSKLQACSLSSPCSSVNTETRSFAPDELHATAEALGVPQPARKRPRIIVIPSVRPSRPTQDVVKRAQPAVRTAAVRAAAPKRDQHSWGSDSADESQYGDPAAACEQAVAADSEVQAAQIMMALKSVVGGMV